jgi:hypothetical protein
MKKITLVAIALLGASPAMAGNIVINGSFEDPGFILNNSTWGQSNTLSGWKQLTGDKFEVQLAKKPGGSGAFNQSYDGARYLELNANALGAVEQTLATIAGQSYALSFGYSGRSDAGGNSKAEVYWGNTRIDILDAASNSGWKTFNYTLQASDSETALRFVSLEPTTNKSFGSYLDGVSVSAVPEPETYAMLLAGLGLMATIARRRKNT